MHIVQTSYAEIMIYPFIQQISMKQILKKNQVSSGKDMAYCHGSLNKRYKYMASQIMQTTQ